MLGWDGRSPASTAVFSTGLGKRRKKEKKEITRFFMEEYIWTLSHKPKRDTDLKHKIRRYLCSLLPSGSRHLSHGKSCPLLPRLVCLHME